MKKIIKEAIEVIKNTINKEEFITKHHFTSFLKKKNNV